MPQPYIIIAEDDAAIAGAYELKLKKEGLDITICQNGIDALEAMKARKPNLVLLDIIMPKLDGFGTLKEMRTMPELADVPVIFLTNLGQDSDKKEGLELGANDYIVKADTPFQEILAKIQSYMLPSA